MNLILNKPEFYNDICESIRAFWSDADIVLSQECQKGLCVAVEVTEGDVVSSRAQIFQDGSLVCEYTHTAPLHTGRLEHKRDLKRSAKLSVYYLFKKHTGIHLPWGSLTGIRPTRLVYEQLRTQTNVADAAQALVGQFDITQEKANLLQEIVETQLSIPPAVENAVDLYIGIPFCPSRCFYCSFASYEADRSAELMDAYLDALLCELTAGKELIAEQGLAVRAVYVGGGTPTTLSPQHMERLLTVIDGLRKDGEFTVEAGRPDTITQEKLAVMKQYGVNRLSINPQTMNAATLELIGRKHTPEEILQAFTLARQFGFEVINADLIAGLPGEGEGEFAHSLATIMGLKPENITVHTLSMKKGSVFTTQGQFSHTEQEVVANMVQRATETLTRSGYQPYYMYRQKYMAGNLENVGYARPGTACLYNLDIMEETQSILAFGAGAISKRVISAEQRIERAPNVKNIREYIARVGEMTARKAAVFKDNQ